MGASTEASTSALTYPPQPAAPAIPLPPSPVEESSPLPNVALSNSASEQTTEGTAVEPQTSPATPIAQNTASDGTEAQADQDDSNMLTPAMRVRRNVFLRMLAAVGNLGLSKKLLLFVKGALTLIQIVFFSVVLGVTEDLPCDKPLRVFLALHVVRVAISFPLSLYQSIAPPRLSRQGNQNAEAVARREANRIIGSRTWDARVKTLSDAFSVAALVIFCLGNWWWWSSGESGRGAVPCRDSSPLLYWSALGALCFGYFYLLEVLLIVLAVVFFLPLVILTLRAFGVGEKKHEIGPLQQSEISKIPLVLYVPGPEDEEPKSTPSPSDEEKPEPDEHLEQQSPVKPAAESKTEAPKGKKGRRFTSLFRSRKRKEKGGDQFGKKAGEESVDGYIAAPYPYHPLPPNQSTCPICLTDFVTPPRFGQEVEGEQSWEPLRLLGCGHCLHMECLDPWLGSSGRCPVCQKPVVIESPARKGKRRATVTSNEPPPV